MPRLCRYSDFAINASNSSWRPAAYSALKHAVVPLRYPFPDARAMVPHRRHSWRQPRAENSIQKRLTCSMRAWREMQAPSSSCSCTATGCPSYPPGPSKSLPTHPASNSPTTTGAKLPSFAETLARKKASMPLAPPTFERKLGASPTLERFGLPGCDFTHSGSTGPPKGEISIISKSWQN